MSLFLLLLLLLAAVVVRAGAAVWRLWSVLPHRNADFGLVDADTGGRP